MNLFVPLNNKQISVLLIETLSWWYVIDNISACKGVCFSVWLKYHTAHIICCAPVAPITPFSRRVRCSRLACSGRLPPSAQFAWHWTHSKSTIFVFSSFWRPLSRAECVAAARCVCVCDVCLDITCCQLYQGFLKLPLSWTP